MAAGLGSGHGWFSGRGQKGQKGRAGPVESIRISKAASCRCTGRLPGKRGFTNIFRTEYSVVNVGRLSAFEAGSVVGLAELLECRAGEIDYQAHEDPGRR